MPSRAKRFSISPKRSRWTVKPSRVSIAGKRILRAAIGRRHGGTADQRLRQRQRIGQIGQSRSNSLMEVFARVCASTVFTITAQYSDGPGDPSGSGLPGKEPGTTTE